MSRLQDQNLFISEEDIEPSASGDLRYPEAFEDHFKIEGTLEPSLLKSNFDRNLKE